MVVTLEQAQYWLDQQREQLGNPPITGVQAYLGDSGQTVAIYVDVENGDQINGGLPIHASFDLPSAMTEDQFDAVLREKLEQETKNRMQ